MIHFSVPGEPQGKGRARAARRGDSIAMITPAKTVAYESLIGMCANTAMRGRPPLAGQVHLELLAYFSVPISWSQKKRDQALQGTVRPGKKPDLDNVIKAIGDGANGIAWADDSQIVEIRSGKWYATTPRVEITFHEV